MICPPQDLAKLYIFLNVRKFLPQIFQNFEISDFSIELVFLAATAAYFYSSSPKNINSGSKIGFLQAVLATFSHFLTLLWQFYRKRHAMDKKLLIYSYIDPNLAVNKSEFLRDKN